MNKDSFSRYEAARLRLFHLHAELSRLDREWREGLEDESSFVGRLERVLGETYQVITAMRDIVRQGPDRTVGLPLFPDKRGS